MIVIGYPGVGKSTLAWSYKEYVDLESSTFFNGDERPEDWYVYYCKIAEDLSKQRKVVFVSSHKAVMDELHNSHEKVVIVYPTSFLKEDWIKKLQDRYDNTHSDKDLKAYLRAKEHYDEDIKLMKSYNFRKVELYDIGYCLKCEIEECR